MARLSAGALAFAITLTLGAGSGFAASMAGGMSDEGPDLNRSKQGIVKLADETRHVLVLDDGSRFVAWRTADADVDISGLQPGTPIIVYYLPRAAGNLMTSYELTR